jgi:hypothetical protein
MLIIQSDARGTSLQILKPYDPLRRALHLSITSRLLLRGRSLLTVITFARTIRFRFIYTHIWGLTSPVVGVIIWVRRAPLRLPWLCGCCCVQFGTRLLDPYVETQTSPRNVGSLRHSRRTWSRCTRGRSCLSRESRITREAILTITCWLGHAIHWL